MRKRPDPARHAIPLLLMSMGIVAIAAGATASGCSEDPGLLPTGGGATGPNRSKELFAALEGEFVAACGACHEAGGIADTPFLAAPDRYQSVTSWPGIVMRDPVQSLLLTYPVTGGGHTGTNLDAADLKGTLLPKITAWLQEEARAIAENPDKEAPTIEPFTPILGFNAIYLDALGDEYKGMAVTFNANELTSSLLELTEIEVHPTSFGGVHLVHPLWVVFPVDGPADPDPTDSFSNVDQYFDLGQADILGPGTLILTNWVQGSKLSIAFEKIEPYSTQILDGGADGGIGGCKDVTAFTTNAQGRFQQNCQNCHGGGDSQAKAAVDMSALTTNPAAACGQIRNRINPPNPPASQIFVTVDPNGNAAHPFKFGGNAAAFNDFVGSVTVWVTAEQ